MRDDDDIRALLAGARADQGPPLGIDPAEIARRGRGIRRRRRQLATAASSLAVLVVAVIAVSVATRPSAPMSPATRPAVTTVAPDAPLLVPPSQIAPRSTLPMYPTYPAYPAYPRLTPVATTTR